MHVFIAIVFVAVLLLVLGRAVSSARATPWAGPRTTAMRSRAVQRSPARGALGKASRTAARSSGSAVLHPRTSQIRAQAKADLGRLREEFWLTDRLEETRAERARAERADQARTDIGRKMAEARIAEWLEERREARAERREARRAKPAAAPPPARSPEPEPVPRRPPRDLDPEPPGAGGWAPPGWPAPPSQEPSSGSNGGTMAAGTSTAGGEQAIEAIDRLIARARSGNALAKREAFLALHEVFTRAGIGVIGLSRDMSEPGSNYGTEITEPLAKAGTQAQASAMCLADADAALVALLRRSLGEQAASGTRTPHHQNELSESGAR